MTAKKQPSLLDRITRARKARMLPPKEGYEVTAEGKEVRTPTAGEFLGNLEKISRTEES